MDKTMHQLLYGNVLCLHFVQQTTFDDSFLKDAYSGKYYRLDCEDCKKGFYWDKVKKRLVEGDYISRRQKANKLRAKKYRRIKPYGFTNK